MKERTVCMKEGPGGPRLVMITMIITAEPQKIALLGSTHILRKVLSIKQ